VCAPANLQTFDKTRNISEANGGNFARPKDEPITKHWGSMGQAQGHSKVGGKKWNPVSPKRLDGF